MFERTFPPLALDTDSAASAACRDAFATLRALLFGNSAGTAETPPLPDLMAGVTALAEGTRTKVILPLARTPLEFALVRRGGQVLVDCYSTESTPEVLLRERAISLHELLDACAGAGRMLAESSGDSLTARGLRKLATRVARTRICANEQVPSFDLVRCTGGSLGHPGSHVPLSFGFEASIPRNRAEATGQHSFADVHALLFEGELWAFSGERRVSLVRGPIMLAAQRMVSAVRALVEAWQAERALNIRLRAGGFAVGIRREALGTVSISLSTERSGVLTWPALDVAAAALPVLRLAADLIRKLVAVDRSQSHNLRVSALRAEVRQLRSAIRGRSGRGGFENRDPERLRLSAATTPAAEAQDAELCRRGRLRYTERWSVEVDALDSNTLFLCGDRLIVATPKLTLALARNTGEVLWSLPSERATTMLVGKSLLRLLPEGGAELVELDLGQVVARSEPSLRLHGSALALFAGGGELPPVAVVSESDKRLIALDLRTGEPRWRYRSPGHGALRLRRAGRVLLVVGGDGSIEALDVASGEVVWRFADRGRFSLTPTIWGELAIAVSGEPGGGSGVLHAIELFSGRAVWRCELSHAPSADPIATRNVLLVPTGRSRDARLDAFDPEQGLPRWSCHDPGLDNGGRALEVDDTLIVNTPAGRVTAIEFANGRTRWSRVLANPHTDDVPRQLEPVLRHGALFLPSAQVHILRPSDGAALTTETGCDLVPDLLRVDERAWFYVAEESGHLRAYASAPQLTLVK